MPRTARRKLRRIRRAKARKLRKLYRKRFRAPRRFGEITYRRAGWRGALAHQYALGMFSRVPVYSTFENKTDYIKLVQYTVGPNYSTIGWKFEVFQYRLSNFGDRNKIIKYWKLYSPRKVVITIRFQSAVKQLRYDATNDTGIAESWLEKLITWPYNFYYDIPASPTAEQIMRIPGRKIYNNVTQYGKVIKIVFKPKIRYQVTTDSGNVVSRVMYKPWFDADDQQDVYWYGYNMAYNINHAIAGRAIYEADVKAYFKVKGPRYSELA